ncbi:MAG TPA: hypothetical protein VN327_00960 [Pseudonocardiaceae bacterium]|jgi:hypothetical protein|nr:hypothetical protein [Pseudonocardiaceae bacterium]
MRVSEVFAMGGGRDGGDGYYGGYYPDYGRWSYYYYKDCGYYGRYYGYGASRSRDLGYVLG